MAKQKIVVKVTMNNAKKSRKALSIAASCYGVESVSFVGADRDQIVVTGEGIDSIQLATLLRKCVGYTDLLSVGPTEKKPVFFRGQQKIVVKVTTDNDKKSRKALVIAASLYGVESASFVGADRDQIMVTSDGIDPVQLTTLLRKGVGYTELISVGPNEEKKKESGPPKAQIQFNRPYDYYYNSYGVPYYYYAMHEI